MSKQFSISHEAVMAEWLRRLTRNQMGYSRAGSNPARSESFLIGSKYKHNNYLVQIQVSK